MSQVELDAPTRLAVIEMTGCPMCLADYGEPCRSYGVADRDDEYRRTHLHQVRINRVFTFEEQTTMRRDQRWRH